MDSLSATSPSAEYPVLNTRDLDVLHTRIESSATTIAAMNQFSGLRNFRDLACFNNKIKPGLLLRSAKPSMATAGDAQILITNYRLRTIIDFRPEMEAKEKDNGQPCDLFKIFTNTFKDNEIDPFMGNMISKSSNRSQTVSAMLRQKSSSSGVEAQNYKIIQLPLALREHYTANIMRRATMSEKWRLVYHGIRGKLGNEDEMLKAKYTGMDVMNKLGLLGMNKMILSKNGHAVFSFLVLCSQSSNYPILMHCSHGKDRTGK